MKQQFIVNTADTFRTYVYENNRKLVPTSATITVYKPGSDVKLVDADAMIIGSDGLLSYDLTADDNAEAGINYQAAISYISASKTSYVTLYYDIVNSILGKVVTDEDVINELPQLKDKGWKFRGQAEGGSATTIIDSELKKHEDDYFTGGLAHSLDKDEIREITDFVSATGTVTVTSFSSAIVAGEKYILTRSYSKEIQRAFEKILEKLSRLGRRSDLVLDPYDLREVHICYAVAEVCKSLIIESQDLWWDLWKEYESKGDEAFSSINFKYDASGDGFIAGSEDSSRINKRKLGRA